MDQVKPLHVALIVKNSPACFERENRNMGMWSYPVPEFTWEHFAPGKGTAINTVDLKMRGFDLIFQEDGGAWSTYKGSTLPVVYYAIDSTLSEDFHFKPRFEQAKQADLVLVDHDRLERFEPCGRPVRRLLYAVNDRLFYPREKNLDVNFQCGGSPERGQMRAKLSEICGERGWTYKSGVSPLAQYAENMGRSKLVVVLPRTLTNRPHRVYDALSSGAAVLSGSLPNVSGENLCPDRLQYVPIDLPELEEQIGGLLGFPDWQRFATAGHEWSERQTWAVRAAELRQMLSQELGL